MPLATWLASTAYNETHNIYKPNVAGSWVSGVLFETALITSMGVNTLVTGMMVFRFLKVMGFKPTSVEQTLGSAGGNKFRHIMFIIIESGMALFAIQMVRVVLVFVPVSAEQLPFLQAAIDFVIVINQMLNVPRVKRIIYLQSTPGSSHSTRH